MRNAEQSCLAGLTMPANSLPDGDPALRWVAHHTDCWMRGIEPYAGNNLERRAFIWGCNLGLRAAKAAKHT